MSNYIILLLLNIIEWHTSSNVDWYGQNVMRFKLFSVLHPADNVIIARILCILSVWCRHYPFDKITRKMYSKIYPALSLKHCFWRIFSENRTQFYRVRVSPTSKWTGWHIIVVVHKLKHIFFIFRNYIGKWPDRR